ncbi:glycine zipper 2TM domain-containing protein [Sphingomonas sp.]|jgi:hypothetical protein|uniref:glycine zipper 2TM domain-containing protein n=1 Tax=Sphingomonas sp. TaxID=28214 RepID=UPI002EDBA313
MFPSFRAAGLTLAACLTLATAPAAAQSRAADARWAQAQARFDRELALYRQEFERHRGIAPRGGYADPAYDNGQYRQAPDRYSEDDDRDENGYDAARYYRSGPNYQERVLSPEDRVYAGQDGRYYCRRSDGTTGLVLGGAAGGILGNVIDGGRSRIVGTLLGGAAGALAGRSVDQNQSQIRCR